MMTREEATKYARSKKMMLESLIYSDDCKYGNYAVYSAELSFINAVLSALRPVGREQVERMRGEWMKTSEYMPIFGCSKCGERNLFRNGDNVFSDFCPACGSPMTDEAVQISLKRLEELKDETD